MSVEESQNVEWKESWRDEYLKWICGFANAQGGKIYIGTNDDGTVTGLQDSKKLMEDIPNKVRDILGIIVDVNLLCEDGKNYIEICVSPHTYPVNYKGEYHYRSGSTKQLLRGQALNQFLLKKTGITWDSVPVQGITVQELRNDSFDIFREQAVKSRRMDEPDIQVGNEQLLDNLNLLNEGLLTRAAVLMFHHNPEKWIPGAYVKIAYFQSESDILYQDEVHGSLLSQADRVVDLIYTKYLKGIISYQNITRVETYPYPKEAIREAILNAIAHKNYATLVPIQIRVYDDKLMIANDCVFPEDWTVDDLMGPHKSRPYNPLVANTFFRSGFIEAWGRGIQKICEACEELGAPMPEYILIGDDLTVKLSAFESAAISETKTPRRQNGGLNGGLADRIIMVILSNKAVTIAEISDILTIPKRTVEREIKNLRESGRITRKGGRRYGYWEIM